MGFSVLKRTVRAVPDEPQNTTTGELFNRVSSLPVQDFVLEILSNVFHKSDFETKFATTGMKFILTRSSMVRLSMGR